MATIKPFRGIRPPKDLVEQVASRPYDVLNSEEARQLAYVQGDEQAGDGGTDVGAHDDPDRLIEGHHARVDKANHHDRGSGGRLNNSGDGRAYQHAQKAVGSQSLQNHFHTAAGCGLQAGAHHLHAVQE